MKTLLALSLVGATVAVSAQVVNPYNPVTDFNNRWFGLVYGTNGQFATSVAANPNDIGWGIHGFLRQNAFFNQGIAGNGTQYDVGDGAMVPAHAAAWVQGIVGNNVEGQVSYNQRGANLAGIANPANNALGPQVTTYNGIDYRLPNNGILYVGPGGNPAERQAGVVSSQAGLRGGNGYLSAFGRSLGDIGYEVDNPPADRGALLPNRDVNRTLFWTEASNLNSNGRNVWGIQFDVANQNSSPVVDDRVTLAVRMGSGADAKWYIAAVLDPVHNVYADVALPSVGDLNLSDLSGYGPGQGVYTLFYDFRNFGAEGSMETRYVWYELTFDAATIDGDPSFQTFDGPDEMSLLLPAEFLEENADTENPVYVTFSQEDLANATAWGVFMRWAYGNRRIDNFFIVTAPGGGGSAAQKRTHAKAQQDALRAARWAHHVRTQQQQRAAQHRRNQQRL